MAEPSPTRRRFRKFSLRGLLVVLALVAIGFGIWINASAQREWRALRAFDKGLLVSLTRRNSLGSLQYVPNDNFDLNADLSAAPWTLWRDDTVQSLFIDATEPNMSATALDPLADIPTVERLELHVDEMDPQSVQSLQALRKLDSLEWSGNFNEACLLALPRMPSIKRLELAPDDYGRLGTGLRALERLPNLNYLVLTVGESDVKDALRHAKLSPTPLAVDISRRDGCRGGFVSSHLSDMSAWSSVHYLRLHGLVLDGSIDFASMPNLQTIDLGSLILRDDDIDQLAKLPKLERVTITLAAISDKQVARLLQNPNLKGVVIDQCKVTSAAFANLSDCSQLELLKVPERTVDTDFLKALRKAPTVKQCAVLPTGGQNGIRNDVSRLQSQIDEVLQRK